MKERIRKLFRQKFDLNEYRDAILQNLLHAQQLKRQPEFLEETTDGDRIFGLGFLYDSEGKQIGLYYTEVAKGDVRRKRVGFHTMMKKYREFMVDAAVVVFDDKHHWRLSYMSDLKGSETSAKRFSYVLGESNELYNTPVNRLAALGTKVPHLLLEDLKETFSVDSLSDEFFKEYHHHYDIIIDYLAENADLDVEDSVLHDYVKKMMGRIVFLHFLQKKGWLNGDTNYLKNLFAKQETSRQADFLEQVLEPLFFGIFNTESDNRRELFEKEGWDKELLEQWRDLPYLNGGLFERDEVDDMRITLPSNLFEDLFEFMASYNFTVDENDPDDAEVGVDPEMLGKIFESLLEDNKAKGAFYTPKEIVRYMCKESLIAYLCEKVSDNAAEGGNNKQDSQDFESEANRSIRRFVETHELPAELEPYRTALSDALREVKICDPAIGSGAFPMGLLNELWRCREALVISNEEFVNGDYSRAELKREIIENNVYGVDIEKGAIDIARLRFWLSIVVDAEKPEPLPNFDYKFMQGNSLIESFDGHDLSHIMDKEGKPRSRGGYQRSIGGQESYQVAFDFSSADTRQNLRLWLKKYFSLTDHREKAEYRQLINNSVKEYIKQQGIGAASEARLNALDPSANQDFFLWHTWFKDIFDNGGFDIVIGNPPYIVVPVGLYPNYEWNTDLYKMFFELSLKELSCRKGIVTLITPKFYMLNKDDGKMRLYFLNHIDLLSLTTCNPFEAVTENVITIIRTTSPLSNIVPCFDYDSESKVFVKLEVLDKNYCKTYKYNEMVLGLSNEVISILQKMYKKGKSLGDITESKRGAEVSKNYLRDNDNGLETLIGQDMRKYSISWNATYLPKTHKEYRRLHLFFGTEVIYLRRVDSMLEATISMGVHYGYNKNVYGIKKRGECTCEIKYLLACINSKAVDFYYKKKFSTKKTDVFPEIQTYLYEQLPIPIASIEQQKPIIDLVDKVLIAKKANPQADTSALEKEIDQMVYELYGLTEEERRIIEG